MKDSKYESEIKYEDEREIIEHRKEIIGKSLACGLVLALFGCLLIYLIKPNITLPKFDLFTSETEETTKDPEAEAIGSKFREYDYDFGNILTVYGIPSGSDITITDNVAYKNLEPGKKYTIDGYLYDADNEKIICTQVTFIPEESCGEVPVEFDLSKCKVVPIPENWDLSKIEVKNG